MRRSLFHLKAALHQFELSSASQESGLPNTQRPHPALNSPPAPLSTFNPDEQPVSGAAHPVESSARLWRSSRAVPFVPFSDQEYVIAHRASMSNHPVEGKLLPGGLNKPEEQISSKRQKKSAAANGRNSKCTPAAVAPHDHPGLVSPSNQSSCAMYWLPNHLQADVHLTRKVRMLTEQWRLTRASSHAASAMRC